VRRGAGQEIGNRLSRWLRLRFFLILLMLAGVSLGAFTVFHLLVKGQDQGATVINISGRQRMLVQRLAADALRLVDAPIVEREALRHKMQTEAQLMATAHRGLEYDSVGEQAKTHAEAILYGEPHRLHQQIEDYNAAVEALISLPDDLLTRDHPQLHKIEDMAGGRLAESSDALVSALAEGMGQRVEDLHTFALVGESAFLVLLVLMAWRVFGPLLRQTEMAFSQLSGLENYHRSVVAALADGIVVIDPAQRRIEAMNPAAEVIFRLTEAEAIGQSLDTLIPVAATQSLPQLRRWHRREAQGVGLDGQPFHLEVTMREAPVDGRDRLIAVVRDVTKQVEAEEKVHTLNHALEQSAASVLITGTDGVIQYANPRACEISGYSRLELLGRTPRLFQSGLTAPAVYAGLWGKLAAGEEWRGELLNRKKTGELYWEFLVISPLRNSRGDITQFMAVMEDITDRKLMEEALLVAKQQAERASRTKSDFLASMSHELRTPLNAIIGYSEFIDTEPFGGIGHPKYKEYLGHIHESGRHLLELINDMLDLSKVEAGKLMLEEEEIDLPHSIQGAMHLVLERANRRQVRLAAEVDPEFPVLYVDNLRLKQVMLNLLTNAIKFTPEGGQVSLRARLGQDGSVTIAVVDTGIGIAPEDIVQVLEPFSQVVNPMVRREEGTGLGLPISKRLVELHGGTLSIASRIGEGTTVTVWLPASRVRASDPVHRVSAVAAES